MSRKGAPPTEPPHGRLFPPAPERAVDEELSFHVEERADELERTGLSRPEARREALRRFGAVESVRQQCLALDHQKARQTRRQEPWRAVWLDTIAALRSLLRDWRYSLTVVVALGVALGGVWALSALVDEVLLRPLPFESPDRLAVIWQNDRASGTRREAASVPDYFDLKERAQTFEGVAAYRTRQANFVGRDGEPRRIEVARVTHDFLAVAGSAPLLGRGFTPREDRPAGQQVALLEESFWREVWGADSTVLGETIRIDDLAAIVVGVVPGGLEIPGGAARVWLPLQEDRESAPRFNHQTLILGRLKHGVALAAAQDEVSAIHADLEREFPQSNQERGGFVEPVVDVLRGDVRPTLLTLLAAVFLVLLVVCANVGNLLLLRLSRLAGELEVRSALGATRSRLSLRFAIEAALLVSSAGALGAIVAPWFRGSVASLGGSASAALSAPLGNSSLLLDRPQWLLAAGALLLVLVLLLAVVPWWQLGRMGNQAVLHGQRIRGGSRRGRAGRGFLVAAQIGLALPLLCGAAALLVSLERLQRVDPGFVPEGVVRMSYFLPAGRYPRDFATYPEWTEVHTFNRRLLEQAAALPGVEQVALAANHPLEPGFTNSFSVVGRSAEDRVHQLGEIKVRLVSPGYFATNQLTLREGRTFDDRDSVDATAVAMLGEEAAQRIFPDGDALGQQIAFWGQARTVVGVVADERFDGLDQEAPFAMYVNLLQAPQTGASTLMVRSAEQGQALRAEQFAAPIREIIRRLDPEIAVYDVATMSGTLAQSLARRRLAMLLFASFAGLALALAGMGIYTVLSATARERRQELGVRLALGASPRRVLAVLVGNGVSQAAVGVLLGVALSVVVMRSLDSLLFGITPLDPRLLALASAGVLTVAALASWLPARRAAAIDPARTLAVD